jgi:16S rRNA (adenine1518-N6/adenine1519-N6)-dimethyltransferase
MLQKEVVERMMAKPKTKQYNAFSILVQKYCNVKKLLNIGKNNFFPVPEVDSTFISIHRNDEEFDYDFEKFIKQCFVAKRKNINNNLKNTKFAPIAKLLNINTRAEELSVNKFIELYKKI